MENGKADAGFPEYINSEKVSFPWSMIDKITPRPDASVEKILLEDGVEGLAPVITAKNTYVASEARGRRSPVHGLGDGGSRTHIRVRLFV